MSYTWTQFNAADGTTALLPPGSPQEDITTGQAEVAFDDVSSGGALDTAGEEEAWPGAVQLTRRGELLASSPSELRATFDALLAMANKAGTLYRQDVASGEEQWCNGRIGSVRATFTPQNISRLPIDMSFVRTSRSWFGRHRGYGFEALYESAEFDDGYSFEDEAEKHALTGSAATSFVVENNGNAAVANAILTITAGDANITSCTLACGLAKWTWTGTLATGYELIIDTGGRDITIDDGSPPVTDAYSGFALHSTDHQMTDWLRLLPGNNSVTMTLVGGGTGSTAHFDFYEAWK